MPGTVIVTAPTLEPVTLAEQRQHMKFTAVDAVEDTLISGWITAARENVEKLTGLKLISQVWKAVYDGYPEERVIKLPFSPVISVDEIKTTDKAAAAVVFASSNYVTDLISIPARVVLKDTASWPAPSAGLLEVNAVEVKCTYGYGVAAASVPAGLKSAIMLLAAHLYENREATSVVTFSELPMGIQALIAPYRTWQRGT